MAAQPQIPELTAEMKAQLQDLGRHLPELWASGRLTPAQQKEVLRSLIRRVILTRPTPDTVEARVVWVSGAPRRSRSTPDSPRCGRERV